MINASYLTTTLLFPAMKDLGYTDIDDEKNFPFKKDFSIKFDIEIYKLKRSGGIQEIVDQFIK